MGKLESGRYFQLITGCLSVIPALRLILGIEARVFQRSDLPVVLELEYQFPPYYASACQGSHPYKKTKKISYKSKKEISSQYFVAKAANTNHPGHDQPQRSHCGENGQSKTGKSGKNEMEERKDGPILNQRAGMPQGSASPNPPCPSDLMPDKPPSVILGSTVSTTTLESFTGRPALRTRLPSM